MRIFLSEIQEKCCECKKKATVIIAEDSFPKEEVLSYCDDCNPWEQYDCDHEIFVKS